MAINSWNNGKPSFAYEGHANLGVNLNRQKNAPLDVSCEFKSVKDMLFYVTEGRYPVNGTGVDTAVKDMKKYPYLSQQIALVDVETESVKWYYIKTATAPAFTGEGVTDETVFAHYFEEIGSAAASSGAQADVDALKIRVTTAENDIDALEGRMDTAEGDIDALEEYAETLKGDASVEGSVAEAKKAGDDAQADVDALEAVVGTDDTNGLRLRIKTNENDIDALEGRVDTAEGDIDALETKVATLIGADADKSVRTIAAEEIASQLIPENAGEALDTLKEIADWIQAHPSDVSEMNTKIQTNADDIDALEGRMDTAEGEIDALQTLTAGELKVGETTHTTIKGYVDAKDEALKTAYEAADTGLSNRIKAVEDDHLTSADKTELTEAIATAKSGAEKTAADALANKVGDIGEGTVKGYVDGKETALNASIKAVDDKVEALGDLAAKDQVAESDLAAALASKINGKADAANTLAGYGITDAMTATEIAGAISAAKGEADIAAGKRDEAIKSAILGKTDEGTDYVGTVKGAYEAAAAAQATANEKTTMAEVEAKNYATKTEAQGYANAKDEAIAAAKKAGDDAQATANANAEAITGINNKIGTVAADTTVVAMISAAQTAAESHADTVASTAKSEAIADAEGKIAIVKSEVIADAAAKDTALKTAILGEADYTQTVKSAYELAASKTTMAEVEAKDYATKTEAQGYANAKDEAIAAAKKAGDDAQADVDALEAVVGTDDTNGLRLRIKTNEDDIDTLDGKMTTLIGDDTAKSVRTIANEELTKQLIPDNANEALDTLKEIADWIQAHPGDAASMNAAITALQTLVGTIPTHEVDGQQVPDYASVVAMIQGMVADEEERATSVESGLSDRIGDLETAIGEGGSVSTQITNAINALDTPEGGVTGTSTSDVSSDGVTVTITQTDGIVTNVEVEASFDDAIEAAKTAAANDATTKANTAETNAKSYADGLKNTIDETVSGVSDRVTTLEGLVGDGFEEIGEAKIKALFNK